MSAPGSAILSTSGVGEPVGAVLRRKLSPLEQCTEINNTFVFGIRGGLELDTLRRALRALQARHPALRMVLRDEADGLYGEDAPHSEIPVRMIENVSAEQRLQILQSETVAEFVHGLPLLRVAWLKGERRSELLITASHAICDGMSMLIILRELLQYAHVPHRPESYRPFTVEDLIGEAKLGWGGRFTTGAANIFLALVPPSRRSADNREFHLQRTLDATSTSTLVNRCKAQGVSVTAVLVAALGRALHISLGRRSPGAIACPIDIRRRLSGLGNDKLFFAAGCIRFRSEEARGEDVWRVARSIQAGMQPKIDEEMAALPSKSSFFQRLRPLTRAQMRTLVGWVDRLVPRGSGGCITLSNLGVIDVNGAGPCELADFSVRLHSFSVRVLGIVVHTLHGRLGFSYTGDERSLDRELATVLMDAFMEQVVRLGRCDCDAGGKREDSQLAPQISAAGESLPDSCN